MTWTRATAEGRCGNCREVIRVHAAVLLVTEYRRPRCRSCAKAMFNAVPPDHWPVPVDVREASSSQPFATPSGWASTQRERFDMRMAAAGADR